MTKATLAITENAARRIGQIIDQKKNERLMLRVTIHGGGCSGFQYEFGLDEAAGTEDLVFEQHGVKVVVDEVSLDLIAGSEIDFVEELIGSAFAVRNPNATSSCGCGISFAI